MSRGTRDLEENDDLHPFAKDQFGPFGPSKNWMIDMTVLRLFVILIAFTLARSRPTTESTHALLKRLGFDPVQRTQVNHHSKRVALETNKARYHNDIYSSNSDSRMFVVKLPPHSPYYSHMTPEKFKNEAVISAIEPPGSGEGGGSTGGPVSTSKQHSFRTNGKPGQIYHWNIPILKRLAPEKRGIVRTSNEDSKVYRIKIVPNQTTGKEAKPQQKDTNKKIKRKNKYEEKLDGIKSTKLHRNKLYRFSDSCPDGHCKNGTDPIVRIRGEEKPQNYHNVGTGNNKKMNDKYVNEVSKKTRTRGPNFYVPAIPKQNSFHKYFTGNGKLKSFYVIEKSKKPTRLHRLL
ncbi:hypothetical protein RUM44_010691 [Polyplax serrata]|uniref:Uncharacterized protein n=1 Tax=Polyplax serrata TaxID=468196 RepID=A0ABR1AMW7_POLSC